MQHVEKCQHVVFSKRLKMFLTALSHNTSPNVQDIES